VLIWIFTGLEGVHQACHGQNGGGQSLKSEVHVYGQIIA